MSSPRMEAYVKAQVESLAEARRRERSAIEGLFQLEKLDCFGKIFDL